MTEQGLGLLLISGGYARAHYAFVLATAAAAIGRPVVLFATNDGGWALAADISGFSAEDESTAARGVASLAELRQAAVALDVRMIACEAGLRMAGMAEPLPHCVEIAGVVTFLEATREFQMMTL